MVPLGTLAPMPFPKLPGVHGAKARLGINTGDIGPLPPTAAGRKRGNDHLLLVSSPFFFVRGLGMTRLERIQSLLYLRTYGTPLGGPFVESLDPPRPSSYADECLSPGKIQGPSKLSDAPGALPQTRTGSAVFRASTRGRIVRNL